MAHTIQDPQQILDWQAKQRKVAAYGLDAENRVKRLILDATSESTYWVVEACNEEGIPYDAFSVETVTVTTTFGRDDNEVEETPNLFQAIEFYNAL